MNKTQVCQHSYLTLLLFYFSEILLKMSMKILQKLLPQSQKADSDNADYLCVIGAGLPRSGTSSLKAALEILGFRPCHHMSELLDKPDR
jgi:hypothetical protein